MRNIRNGRLALGGDTVDYVQFGRGGKTMVILPGVGDGFKTVKGAALPFALMYRTLSRDFTVYVISRRNRLSPGTSTRAMAEDLNRTMELLGLKAASVVGVSQGGMIAQWLAIDHPEKVSRLVLTVTMGRPNPVVTEVVGRWLDLAKAGDYRGILLDFAERSYTPARLRTQRLIYFLLGRLGKPKSFDRFIIQAQSCLTHNAYDALGRIACPVLVIGGTQDGIVTGAASEELAGRIPNCKLFLYKGLRHGLYEEAPDFLDRVKAFCLSAGE